MKTIDIIYFKAGGGHVAAANSLKTQLNIEGYDCRLLDLRDDMTSLAARDFIYKYTGIKFESFYNFLLRRDFTYGIDKWLHVGQFLIRSMHNQIVSGLREFWDEYGIADVVVSTIPNFNRQIFESIDSKAKMFTVMNDFSDLPPHFWNEPDLDIHLIVPTEFAFNQAMDSGTKYIYTLSGLVINPNFYSYSSTLYSEDKKVIKQAFGFNPEKPVVIISFGAAGSSRIYRFAKYLANNDSDIQCLFICGKNKKVYNQILTVKCESLLKVPWVIFDFVDNIPYYLSCGDLFIGKPGPNSIAEALAMRLPVFLEDHRVMDQERYNLEWVKEKKVGVIVPDLGDCLDTLTTTLENLDVLKASANTLNNRGIFEISKILMS